MADIPNRSEAEARLAEALGRTGRQAIRNLISALGDPPDINNLPPQAWDDVDRLFQAVLISQLTDTFTESVLFSMQEVGLSVDVATLNVAAIDWARSYSFDLVRGLTSRGRTILQDAVSDFYRLGLNIGDIRRRLEGQFGEVRAGLIAISETTRAGEAAEQALRAELARMGVQTRPIWHTVSPTKAKAKRKGTVCPLCAGRDGKAYGDGWTDYPPAHPGCRCFTTTEIVQVA